MMMRVMMSQYNLSVESNQNVESKMGNKESNFWHTYTITIEVMSKPKNVTGISFWGTLSSRTPTGALPLGPTPDLLFCGAQENP